MHGQIINSASSNKKLISLPKLKDKNIDYLALGHIHKYSEMALDEKGIVNIFMVLSDILSGLVLPIPFFPNVLQKISNFLPYRYVSDFPFRLYVGNISLQEGIKGIIIQIIWIIILILIGKLITKKALKKVVIQGG